MGTRVRQVPTQQQRRRQQWQRRRRQQRVQRAGTRAARARTDFIVVEADEQLIAALVLFDELEDDVKVGDFALELDRLDQRLTADHPIRIILGGDIETELGRGCAGEEERVHTIGHRDLGPFPFRHRHGEWRAPRAKRLPLPNNSPRGSCESTVNVCTNTVNERLSLECEWACVVGGSMD